MEAQLLADALDALLEASRPEDSAGTWQAISAAVDAGHLPRYAIPERVSFVAALPKTSVGKIDKRKLREGGD
ncbi:MAG: hypothetical protein ACKPE6_04160 [Gammaproteobacteria bacterium]